MSTGTIYFYKPINGEYAGEGQAPMDTLETEKAREFRVMVPANATDIQPPAAEAGKVRVFIDAEWRLEEDHRGKVLYSTTDKSKKTIKDIGPLPNGCTELKPGEFDTWENGAWVEDSAAKRNALIANIKSLATQKILAIIPAWQQRNMIAQSLELTRRQIAGDQLTNDERAELDNIEAVWNSVKLIRAYSNDLEQKVITDPAIDIKSGWPT